MSNQRNGPQVDSVESLLETRVKNLESTIFLLVGKVDALHNIVSSSTSSLSSPSSSSFKYFPKRNKEEFDTCLKNGDFEEKLSLFMSANPTKVQSFSKIR